MVFFVKNIEKNSGYNYVDVVEYTAEDVDQLIYKNSISPDFTDTGDSVIAKSASESDGISLWLWFLIVFIFTLVILITIWYYKIFPKSWFRKFN